MRIEPGSLPLVKSISARALLSGQPPARSTTLHAVGPGSRARARARGETRAQDPSAVVDLGRGSGTVILDSKLLDRVDGRERTAAAPARRSRATVTPRRFARRCRKSGATAEYSAAFPGADCEAIGFVDSPRCLDRVKSEFLSQVY
jgi:hypothetical protein